MQKISDWMFMPETEYVVELDKDDLVIKESMLFEVIEQLDKLKVRIRYYDERPDTYKVLSDIEDQLQFILSTGESISE